MYVGAAGPRVGGVQVCALAGPAVPLDPASSLAVHAHPQPPLPLPHTPCSYEMPNDPDFRSTRLSLVDRGITFAIAHVRGGGTPARCVRCASTLSAALGNLNLVALLLCHPTQCSRPVAALALDAGPRAVHTSVCWPSPTFAVGLRSSPTCTPRPSLQAKWGGAGTRTAST